MELLAAKDAAQEVLFAGDGRKGVSVGDLLEGSKQLAYQLYREGMREDDRIVIAAQPGEAFLKVIFATMILKAKVAIIDPEMGQENYLQKLEQFQPQWAVLDSRLLILQEHPLIRAAYFYFRKNGFYFPYQSQLKIIATGPWMPIVQKHRKLRTLIKRKPVLLPELLEGAPDQEYLVTYTSGTSSRPKGVLHSIQSLANSIEIIIDLLAADQPQRMATHLPHFMLISVCAGIPVQIWSGEMSAKERLRFLEEKKITTLFGPPAEYLELIKTCQQQGKRLPDTLQHVLLGSAPVHAAFLQKLHPFLPAHTKITCLYGMTENLVVATADGREKMNSPCPGDLLGWPAPGLVIDGAADGEIRIRSNQLFCRYWHEQDRSVPHHTGDLGYLDEEGRLILTGRKKDMIIRRNFNLYPALYENTIKKIPGIQEAVFVGIYQEDLADEWVYLIVELENNVQLTEKEIMRQLQKGKFSIDKEAWPDQIVIKNIPRKGRQQKIDREALRTTFHYQKPRSMKTTKISEKALPMLRKIGKIRLQFEQQNNLFKVQLKQNI